jgi:hypothetical protein
MGVRTDAATPIEHGAMCAARKLERSSIVALDLHGVRQINGDLRIDDGDEGPMLKVEFFDKFASELSDEDKDQILEAVVIKMAEILEERNVR